MNLKYPILFFLFSLCIPGILRAQWTKLSGPTGANVYNLVRNGVDNALYLTSNGRLFKSVNNADTWTEVVYQTPGSLYLDEITIDGSGNFYGVNYSQVYKSTDGGLNWTKLNNEGDFYGVFRILRFGPNNFLAVYGWNGLYISKNEGVSWVKAHSMQPYDLKATAAGDLYAAVYKPDYTEARIVKYTYPGVDVAYAEANWQTVYSNTGWADRFRLLITPAGKIYAAVHYDLIASPTGALGTWVSTKNGDIPDTEFYENQFVLASDGTILFANGWTDYSTSPPTPPKIYRSTDQGANWTGFTNPTSTFGSSATKIIHASGSTYYLGSNSDGIFKSTDAGATWVTKNSGLLLGTGREIEIANTTNRIIYLNNWRGKGYWTSTDNGVNWSFVPLSDYTEQILKLSDGKILLHSGGPVFRSDDNGVSFSKVSNYYINEIVEDGSGNLFGADYRAVYKSVDKGTTWVNLADPSSPVITGLPTDFNGLYIALDNANNKLFLLLEDRTDNYKRKLYSVPVAGGAATVMAKTPWYDDDNYANVNNMFINNNKLYVAEYNSFYESADGGQNWTTNSFSGERVFPITGGLCVGKSGSLYITQDGGKSWNSTTLPNSNSVIYDIAPITGGFIAAALNSPALKFTGNLILPPEQLPPFIDFNWQPMQGPYGGEIRSLFTDNSNNVFAVANGNLYKTFGLASWSQLPNPPVYLNEVAFDKANNAMYALGYHAVAKSTNGGSSWTTINTESIECAYGLTRAMNGDLVFQTYCQNSLYISSNSGVSFGAPKLVAGNTQYTSYVGSSNSAIFAAVYDNSGGPTILKKTTDHGATWTDVSTPHSNFGIADDGFGGIFLWNNLRIYKTTNDGTTWTEITGDLPPGTGRLDKPFKFPSGDLAFTGFDFVLQKSGFYKTSNGGVNWTFTPTDFGTNCLTAVGTAIVAGTNTSIYSSSDNGATFQEKVNGIAGHSISDLELVSTSKLYALTYSQNAFMSSNSSSWTKNTMSARRFLKNPDGTVLAYGGGDIFRSNDQGATWGKFASYPSYIDELVTGNGTLYFVHSNNQIKYTSDFITWNTYSVTGLPASYYFSSMRVNAFSSIFIILYNTATQKNEAYQILFGSAIPLKVKPQYPQNFYYDYAADKMFLYDGVGLIYSTSDGSSWSTQSAPSGDRLIVASKNYYFIPQYGGVLWLSRNQGQTWQNVGLSSFQPDRNFQDVVINEFNGYAYGAVTSSAVLKSNAIVLPAETTVPVVTALSPLNNATGVSVKPALSITFDEAVVPVAGKIIKVLDAANSLITLETFDATSSVQNGKTFTFNMSTVLAFNKTYFVVVEDGAFADVFGNPMVGWLQSTTTWKFTTKNAPTLVSTTPANNATNVSVKTTLAATFSEPMSVVNGKKMYLFNAAQPSTALATVTLQSTTSEFLAVSPAGANAEQPVTVRFDASKGKGELMGADKVYLHLGVVVKNTTSPIGADWRYVKSDWGLDNGVGQMTKVAGTSNIWEITLGPTLRQYFGVPSTETIYYLAIVVRNAPGTVVATPPASIANAVIFQPADIFLALTQTTTPVCSTAPSQSGNSLIFNTCTSLAYGQQYFMKFDAGSFQTNDGAIISSLTANTDWVFNSEPGPAVSTLLPAKDATNIAINSTFSITFNDVVTAVNGKKLTLYNNTTNAVVQSFNVETATVNSSTHTFTFTPANALANNQKYYLKFDAGAFLSKDGISMSFIQANTDWAFTTVPPPDNTAPTITHTPANFTKGGTNKLQITVTDTGGSGVDPASIKVSYRGITSTASYTVATLTAAGSGYEVVVPDSWLDELGLEYKFEAKDLSGNTATNPTAAAVYFKAYITYPSTANPALPSSILSFGGEVTNYRIFSIPFKLEDPKISTIFNELGNPNIKNYRILTYAGNNTYNEYPATLTSIARGTGYWINIRTSTTIAVENASTPTDSKEAIFSMSLKPGWNQIGNPYPFTISWTTVAAAAGNTNIGVLKSFNGTTFVNDDKINPFEGGFVFLNGSANATVPIPFTAKTTAGRQRSAEQDFTDGWFLPIHLNNDVFSNDLGGIGMHPAADPSFDRFDDAQLPKFLDVPEILFSHAEHFSRNFTRDIVPLTSSYAWEFTLQHSQELSWDISQLNGRVTELYLVDETEQKLVDMLAHSHYKVNSTSTGRFRIYAGVHPQDIKPSHISLGKPYPNPSTGKSRIGFALPEASSAYKVSLGVYDMFGKKIQTLAEGEFNGGFYESEWLPADNVSNAVYLYRLSVEGKEHIETFYQKIFISK